MPTNDSRVTDGQTHVSSLMPAFDYEKLAPAELLVAQPQKLLPGALSYLNIPYASALGWRPLLLDVHLPDEGQGPFSAVIYVHGGSFLGGVKAMGPWRSLPSAGIAVISVSYRFSGEAQYPEPIEDVRAAVRWTRANATGFNLAPDALALWGSSAGAYLASMAAVIGDSPLGRPVGEESTTSARVTCVVNHYGISDFATLREDAFENDEAEKDALALIVRQFLGFDPAVDHERALAATPVKLAADHPDTPPFLFMHGDKDRRVGYRQSLRFHQGLLQLGRSSTLVTVPGADHGDKVFEEEDVVNRAVAFLRGCWAEAAGRNPLGSDD